METFFSPRGVAIVGASSSKGKIGYEILSNLLACGSKAYPVNPTADHILGQRCYVRVSDIPEPVDMAVVALPADAILSIIDDCGRKGVTALIIISGGFKEVGRADLEQEMVERAHHYGMRIIGPNCIGVYNSVNGFNTFFQREMNLPPPGNIAIVTQSGTIGIGLLEQFAAGIGVSKFISLGNKADVTEIDLLAYLKNDYYTDIVAMYLEDVKDGRTFFTNLPRKPTVILKAGRTTLGEQAASSHTGAMASNNAIFNGAAHQHGALLADNTDHLFDITRFLALQPLPAGGCIAMITNGAGPCVMAADYIYNTRFLSLSQVNVDALQKTLPPFAICSNPIDLTGSATAEHYLAGIQALENDANVDIIISFFVFQDAPLIDSLPSLYSGLEKLAFTKPIVAVAMGGKSVDKQESALLSYGIPLVHEPERAIRALNTIVEYVRWRS